MDELINTLKQNIRDHGGRVSNHVDVKNNPLSGYGIFANNYIQQGDELVSIPFSVCISVESIKANPALSKIFVENPGLDSFPDEILSIGLMYAKILIEKGVVLCDQCPWLVHVKTMPSSLNSPLFWSDDEIEELRPSNVYHLTKLLSRQILADWESIHSPLSQEYEVLSGISIDHYKWALSMIYSRAFGFYKGDEYIRCIVPLFDMANHNPETATCPSQTFQYSEEENSIKIISSQDKIPNAECYAFYGAYPNAKLLHTYGFVIVNCPNRAVDLWTRVSPSTYLAEAKQKLLSSNALTKDQYYDFTGTIREGFVAPALLATIRVIQANQDELPRIANAFRGEMISVRNELSTYNALRELVVVRMNPSKAQVSIHSVESISCYLSLTVVYYVNSLNIRRIDFFWGKCC